MGETGASGGASAPASVKLSATIEFTDAAPAPTKKCGGGSGGKSAPPKNDPFDDKFKELLKKSPTLTGQIQNLKKNGWKFKKGTPGKGTFSDRKTKTVTVDPNNTDAKTQIQLVAHEVGHANYKMPKPISPKFDKDPKHVMGRNTYIEGNVTQDLRDEGAATTNNLKIRDEILKNGGPDIGVAGAQPDKYKDIYKRMGPDLPGTDRVTEMGKLYGKGEHPSNAPTQTYHDYYAGTYAKWYDNTYTPWLTKNGLKSKP